jgi:hypothetical protein
MDRRTKQFTPRQVPQELWSYYGGDQSAYSAQMRSLIIKIAQQYNVDPVTLVATPLAENTMNVDIKDKVQDELEAQGRLDDDGRIIHDGSITNYAISWIDDKPMSIGPGQIYVFAANHVEKLAASIEGRPLRSKKEIKAALKTRGGALRYAAAILRDAQDMYAQAGFDISRRPDVLATLYNIGKVKDRLRNFQQRYKDTKGRAQPLPNYFGYWVGANYRLIQQRLQLPSKLD